MALVEARVGRIGVVLLLVAADPVRGRRRGEHCMAEAAAARGAGHDVALVGRDALAEPGGPGGQWPARRKTAVRRCTAGDARRRVSGRVR